jgi:hypothetical protein
MRTQTNELSQQRANGDGLETKSLADAFGFIEIGVEERRSRGTTNSKRDRMTGKPVNLQCRSYTGWSRAYDPLLVGFWLLVWQARQQFINPPFHSARFAPSRITRRTPLPLRFVPASHSFLFNLTTHSRTHIPLPNSYEAFHWFGLFHSFVCRLHCRCDLARCRRPQASRCTCQRSGRCTLF